MSIQAREAVCAPGTWNTQMLYFTCSSLSEDDRRIYLISDQDGHPNVYVHDLKTGEQKKLSDNQAGALQSYVYFNGQPGIGLGKASVALDARREKIYYIQNGEIIQADREGCRVVLNHVPADQVTAFTCVSGDGQWLCVPTTDARILDYDPDREGFGLDKRPIYDIDQRVQDENLSSYLHVYSTQDGREAFCERVPRCWITHVQFHPLNPRLILYNHEWPCRDCGIRRIHLFDGSEHRDLRTVQDGRSAEDWVCHEMWSQDGRFVFYHGQYASGRAFIGRYTLSSGEISEIAIQPEYRAYGHFYAGPGDVLVTDGCYRQMDDVIIHRENSTDHGPDPQLKNGQYISLVLPDWKNGTLTWRPLCRHDTNWLGQDTHPHPIFSHAGDKIYFSSAPDQFVGVYRVDTKLSVQKEAAL